MIRASCPDCGDVELVTRDVKVLLCTSTSQSTYAFQCPGCRLAVVKPAEPRVVDVLVSAGVPLTVWNMPPELAERPGDEVPPVEYDDLLEFHFQLKSLTSLADALKQPEPDIQDNTVRERY
jgi:hypothetical protein